MVSSVVVSPGEAFFWIQCTNTTFSEQCQHVRNWVLLVRGRCPRWLNSCSLQVCLLLIYRSMEWNGQVAEPPRVVPVLDALAFRNEGQRCVRKVYLNSQAALGPLWSLCQDWFFFCPSFILEGCEVLSKWTLIILEIMFPTKENHLSE